MYENNISWTEFKTRLDVILQMHLKRMPPINDLLFRGQASPAWMLSSSFDRIEPDKSKYEILIGKFKSICNYYGHNDELLNEKMISETEVAAYAQHYGLPTRLLDWTQSPYYAAFFAFSETNFKYDKATSSTVWVINRHSEALKRKGGIVFVDIPSGRANYRMRNQIGHFSLSQHLDDSIEDFDQNLITQTGINDLLWKINIEIPVNVNVILQDLNLMGINFGTVYPDLHGFIKQAVFESGIGA